MRGSFTYPPEARNRPEPGPLCGRTYHIVAGLHILSDTVADQRWLRGAVDKRYKLILVVFWEVFVLNLKEKRKLREGRGAASTSGHRLWLWTQQPG